MPDISRSLAARLVEQAWSGVDIDGTDPLGSGSSGVVWPARAGDESEAVKIIELIARSRIRSGSRVSAASELNREWRRVTEEASRLESLWIVGIEDCRLIEERSNEDEVKAYGLVRMERWPWNLDRYVVRNFETLGAKRTADVVRIVARTLDGIWRDKRYIFADLKPENLLIKELGDGSVRVVIGDIGGLQGLSSLTSQAARTAVWSAPECVISGDKSDLVATIFGFGLVAYFIAEGHLPYEDAGSARERLALLRERGPDFRDDLPRELDRVVATIKSCLSHEREKRPQTFEAVLEGLRSSKRTDNPTRTVGGASGAAPPKNESDNYDEAASDQADVTKTGRHQSVRLAHEASAAALAAQRSAQEMAERAREIERRAADAAVKAKDAQRRSRRAQTIAKERQGEAGKAVALAKRAQSSAREARQLAVEASNRADAPGGGFFGPKYCILDLPTGSQYRGECRRGVPDGYGSMTFTSTGRYDGQWRAGGPHGHGVLKHPWSQDYEGQFENGERNGYGVGTLTGNLEFVGRWQDGLPSGAGAGMYLDNVQEGIRFEGDWLKHDAHGYGVFVMTDGTRFEGEARHGGPNGVGVLVLTEASATYEGEIANGQRHGYGVMAGSEGGANFDLAIEWESDEPKLGHVENSAVGRYSGEFQEGALSGLGVTVDADGDRYEGMLKAEERHGFGIYRSASGARYEGEYESSLRTGHGVEHAADGSRYEGEWRKGKRHGHGVECLADGRRREGAWQDGQFKA